MEAKKEYTYETVKLVKNGNDIEILRLGHGRVGMVIRRDNAFSQTPLLGVLDPDGVVAGHELVPLLLDLGTAADVLLLDLEDLLHGDEDLLRDGCVVVDVQRAVVGHALGQTISI